jgi:hypothetical protein
MLGKFLVNSSETKIEWLSLTEQQSIAFELKLNVFKSTEVDYSKRLSLTYMTTADRIVCGVDS